MIEVAGLRKRFGRLEVLRGVGVAIPAGRITAVLGPNGAGKTTLLKSILGLVRPDGGDIRVGGRPVRSGDSEYRRDIGYMPQIARYPENLTAREILDTLRELRGDEVPAAEGELVELLGLQTELDKPFRTLSGGNRQRLSAVLALRFGPPILFLDEPTAGLDPLTSSRLKDRILEEKARGVTVVLTSHLMGEVQELADRIVYLLDGTVLFEEDADALLERTGERTLERAIARMMTTGGSGTAEAPHARGAARPTARHLGVVA